MKNQEPLLQSITYYALITTKNILEYCNFFLLFTLFAYSTKSIKYQLNTFKMSDDQEIFNFCQLSFLQCLGTQQQSPQSEVQYFKPSHRLTNPPPSSKKVSLSNSVNSKRMLLSQELRRHTFGTHTNNRVSLRQKKRNHTERIMNDVETSQKYQQKNTNYTSTIESKIFHSSIPITKPINTKYVYLNQPCYHHRNSQTTQLYYRDNQNKRNNFYGNPQVAYKKQLKMQKVQSIKSYTHNSQKKFEEKLPKQLLNIPQQQSRNRTNTELSEFSKSIDDLDIRQTVSMKDSDEDSDQMSLIQEEDLDQFDNLKGLKAVRVPSNKRKDNIENILPDVPKKKISLKRKDTNLH